MLKVETNKAPAAIGPYSQAVISGGFIFVSGQISPEGTIEEQTRRIIQNISAILAAAGSGLGNVVKTTCFLNDMADFAAFNGVYGEYFTSRPARSCIAAAALPKGAAAEIEVIAER